MKAYHLERFGDVDGIVLRDDPVPQPGPSQIVVRLHARSLNYRDLLILARNYPLSASDGVVPLSDGAGEIVAVAEGVDRFSVGERVAAFYFPRWRDGAIEPDQAIEQFGFTRDGMLAEFVVADQQAFVKFPEHLSFPEAATLPCAGITAWSAVNGPRRVPPGETVLTIGAGGVALFALQFAKTLGARVISDTSTEEKGQLLRSLGADDVICSGAIPDWQRPVREMTAGRGVDHVVETGSVETLPKSLASCAWNAEVALVLALPEGTIDVGALRGLITLRRLFVGSRASFEAMNRAITLHRLRPVIDRVFPLHDAKAAYRHSRRGGTPGRSPSPIPNEPPGSSKTKPLSVESYVMFNVSEIVGNYVAVWNEADLQQRRRRIEAVWALDGTSCYRVLDAHGYDAIEGRVAGSWDKWLSDGKYVFRPKATVCHHDVIKSAWEMVTVPDGEVEANGLSFLVLDPDGRIRHDFQFNPSLNDADALAGRHHAAESELDAARRRHLIAELWAPDGAYVTDRSASRGEEEIDAAIAGLQADQATRQLTLAPAERSQAHHQVAWLQAPLRTKEGDRAVAIVTHLLVLGEDGRIGSDYRFDEPAEQGAAEGRR